MDIIIIILFLHHQDGLEVPSVKDLVFTFFFVPAEMQ